MHLKLTRPELALTFAIVGAFIINALRIDWFEPKRTWLNGKICSATLDRDTRPSAISNILTVKLEDDSECCTGVNICGLPVAGPELPPSGTKLDWIGVCVCERGVIKCAVPM